MPEEILTTSQIPTTEPPITPEGSQATTKMESGKTHVRQAAEDLRSAAEMKAQELRHAAELKAQELRGRAEQAYGDARERAISLRDETEKYVRENPMKAVMTALGVGFLAGLIFRSK
jgi:ElaB/YqjD/DUF883 family membrane-anchored ribosome-binding protein